jgi:hypothetical protein
MFRPVFPYKGNQIILTSDRVTIHSGKDAIFLFGKQAVGLSSTKTVNLDAGEKIILAAPVIELGNKAEALGEPVVLGNTLNQQLQAILSALSTAGTMLAQVSTSSPGSSMQSIASAGKILNQEASRIAEILNPGASIILSKNTFTR